MPSSHLLRNELLRATLSPLTNGHISTHIRPTIAAVYLTRFCNSRCSMCDFWKNERDPNELSSEQWGVIFSRLKAFGVDFIGINASGEMFTRRDVFDILGHLRDLGLGFGVNTNGTLLTTRKAQLLAQLNPRQITIGLDGVGDESYFVTRGLKHGFTKIGKHIDNLQKAGIQDIYIGSVLMRENLNDWANIAQFAVDKHLAGVRFTAFHDSYFSQGDAHTEHAYADPKFIETAEAEIEKLIALKRRTGIIKNSEEYLRRAVDYYRQPASYFPVPCLQGSNRIEVDVYGNVTLCSFMTAPLGNLVRQDMENIWESEKHRLARQAAYNGDCPKCFLSCYGEENLRLSARGFISTFGDSLKRGYRLLGN